MGELFNGTGAPAVKVKIHRLRITDFVKLTQALQPEADRIRRDRPTRKEVADLMSCRLGFLVTECNVSKAAEAINLDWIAKTNRTGGRARYETLRRVVDELTGQVKSLVERVEALERLADNGPF